MSFAKKVTYPFTFSVCTFSASRVTRQIKMRRVVEYPFRRRTAVQQRRISAREKVNMIKIKGKPLRLPFLNFELILLKSLNLNKSLYPMKI